MKRTIFVIALIMSMSTIFAQKNPFEKFSDMDGVTSVYISKNMLSLFPKKAKMDYGGVDVGNFVHKLSSILILTSENPKIANEMVSLANNRVKRKEYELLMRVKSEDRDNVKFFMRGTSKKIHELIMIVDSDGKEGVVMQFLGNFTLQDVQQMTGGIEDK